LEGAIGEDGAVLSAIRVEAAFFVGGEEGEGDGFVGMLGVAEIGEVLAEGGEGGADFVGVLAGPGEEVGEGGDGEGFGHKEDAQAVGMVEFEGEEIWGELLPELVDAEVALADLGIVEEDDALGGEFGEPGIEVVADGGVGVEAIDVEEVDGGWGEGGGGGIEGGGEESGEAGIEGVVVGAEGVEDFRAVVAGVGVALPGVDGGGLGVEVQGGDGLAEGTIGVAGVGAQFDEGAWSEPVDEGHGEGDMANPGGSGGEEAGRLEGEIEVVDMHGVWKRGEYSGILAFPLSIFDFGDGSARIFALKS